MTRVHLHPLPGAKRAGKLAALVEQLHRDRQRVVVRVADDRTRHYLTPGDAGASRQDAWRATGLPVEEDGEISTR